jgi:hypothetical protein
MADIVTRASQQKEEKRRDGIWWLAAIGIFLATVAVDAVVWVVMERSFARIFYVPSIALLGAVLCLIATTVSIVRRERQRRWAVIPAVPCAVLFGYALWTVARNQVHRVQSDAEYKIYSAALARIRADPELPLREHWSGARTTPESRAFFDAVWAPYVNFSPEQIERIYAEQPGFRSVVFRQPACTPEFIAAHFDEACALARQDARMLENLVENRHTPLRLLQTLVLRRPQLPFEPVYSAELLLQIRRGEFPADWHDTAGQAKDKFIVLLLHGREFRTLAGGNLRRFPGEVNAYVPGVPDTFDLNRPIDDFVFLPGLFEEHSPEVQAPLHAAETYAAEHNRSLPAARAAASGR